MLQSTPRGNALDLKLWPVPPTLNPCQSPEWSRSFQKTWSLLSSFKWAKAISLLIYMHTEADFSSESSGGGMVPLAMLTTLQIKSQQKPSLLSLHKLRAVMCAQAVIWCTRHTLCHSQAWAGTQRLGTFSAGFCRGAVAVTLILGSRNPILAQFTHLPDVLLQPSNRKFLCLCFVICTIGLLVKVVSSFMSELLWFCEIFPFENRTWGSREDPGLGVWRFQFCLVWSCLLALSTWANSFIHHSVIHSFIALEPNTNHTS